MTRKRPLNDDPKAARRRAARKARQRGRELNYAGLTREPDGVFRGRIDGHQVSMTGDDDGWAVHIALPAVSPEVVIGAESALTGIQRLIAPSDVELGDPPFDAEVRILGPRPLVVALCTKGVRGRLRTLVSGLALRVEGQAMTARLPRHSQPWVRTQVRSMARLARALRAPSVGLPARLLRNGARDPIPAVRQLNLSILLKDHWQALSAPQQDALIALAAEVPGLEAQTLGVIEARLAATAGDLAALPAPALCLLIDSGPADRRLAAVRLLGDRGGEAAVPALTGLADAFFGRGELKVAARTAIGQIMARIGTLRAGGLSVVEGEAGALGLLDAADDDDGWEDG